MRVTLDTETVQYNMFNPLYFTVYEIFYPCTIHICKKQEIVVIWMTGSYIWIDPKLVELFEKE